MQASTDSGFEPSVQLGTAREAELERPRLFDFTGDGRADLLTVRPSETSSVVELRRNAKDGLADTRVLITLDEDVSDVRLGRTGMPRRPVEAVALTTCDDRRGCVVPLVGLSGMLVTEEQHSRAMTVRLIRSLARAPSPYEMIYQ